MSKFFEKTNEDSYEKSSNIEEFYRHVRQATEARCTPLHVDDFGIQSMPDVSPVKWHLAHTTWFFETFILIPFAKKYRCFHPQFNFIFNSYYKSVGAHFLRSQRGILSRPTLEEVKTYRKYVDQEILKLLGSEVVNDRAINQEMRDLVELGCHHEQQHQELILTDILHVFWSNPLSPSYLESISERTAATISPPRWREFSEGVREMGYCGDGFSFDNERPRHRIFQSSFKLASRLVTNGEFLEFILDEGYHRPEYWLADAWDLLLKEGWNAPLYWRQFDGKWNHFTLRGWSPLFFDEPVSHLSYYEADAFARWAGKRLPTEAEWEIAAQSESIAGNFYESSALHPVAAASTSSQALQQLFGDVWEWTQSAYAPYHGFHPERGALGEYNGKFMSGQMVLRGGSCFSPASHLRATYRNFFPPNARWQCSGFRLAEDL